jgi:hypothetical protein
MPPKVFAGSAMKTILVLMLLAAGNAQAHGFGTDTVGSWLEGSDEIEAGSASTLARMMWLYGWAEGYLSEKPGVGSFYPCVKGLTTDRDLIRRTLVKLLQDDRVVPTTHLGIAMRRVAVAVCGDPK